MRYSHFKYLYKNRNYVFSGGYNSADGTTTDASTDPVITRDPNNYLVPRVNAITVSHTLLIAVGILAVIILLPMAIKTLKQY